MSTPRLSLEQGATEKGSKRQKRVDHMKKFTDEGWAMVKKGNKLYKKKKNDLESHYPLHWVKKSDTKYEIFLKLMPHSLIMEIFDRRIEERDCGLTFDKGNGLYYTMKKAFLFHYIFLL